MELKILLWCGPSFSIFEWYDVVSIEMMYNFSHLLSIAWVLEYFYCSGCGENVLDEQNAHEKSSSFYFYENGVTISKGYKKLLPEIDILKPSLCFRARSSLAGKTFS